MPIYEYECPSCGNRFEKLVKVNAEPPPCDACGSGDVRKLVSASGFILKGGGWYKDHYGLKSSDGKKSSEGGTSDSGKKAESTSSPSPAKSE